LSYWVVYASTLASHTVCNWAVTPPVPPVSRIAYVMILPPAAGVDVGDTYQLSATAYEATGAPLAALFTWSSSNPAVATVDADGYVTGRAAGVDTIRATAQGVSGLSVFTVLPPAVPPPVAREFGLRASWFSFLLNGCAADPGTSCARGPIPVFTDDGHLKAHVTLTATFTP
jgi:hypothetical protein